MAIAGLPEEEYFSYGHRACSGCGAATAMRILTKAVGKNSILVESTGCMEVVSTPYPETAWKLPWIHGAFENPASIASGICAALKAKGLEEKINVIAFGGDGAIYDIGFGYVSGAFERGDNFALICYDNEAYMNCLSTSSLIMTKGGLKRITEISVGDYIYAFDQKSHKLVLKRCAGVFDNGIRDVYELETLHHSIKATSNHPFLTLKRNGRGRRNTLIWKTLSELRQGDEVIVLKNLDSGKSFKFNINRVKKGDYKVNRLNEINLPEYSSPELMRYLGIWVGDGWIRPERGEVGFALPEGSMARDTMLELNSDIFDINVRVDDEYVYVNSVNLVRFINSLGFGSGAKNKIIPPWIFTLPREEKEGFIQGLMLSDGYKINGSYRYVSSSYELLRSLRLFLQTVGWRIGRIHWQKKKKGTKVVYRELLKDSEYGYVCFSRRAKWNTEKYPNQYRYQNFLIENEYFEMEKVMDIKLIGKEPTLDLRVEDEHNFIADGIVVHNTGIQRSGATPYGASTTTSPAGKMSIGKVEWKKDIIRIIAAHGSPYVASASIGYPVDAFKKIRKAIETKGPTFVNLFATCPTGWRSDPAKSIELAKLAVETGIAPLYEIVNGKHIVNMPKDISKLKPIEEYLKLQGRYRHLFKPERKEREIGFIQERVKENLRRLIEYSEKGF